MGSFVALGLIGFLMFLIGGLLAIFYLISQILMSFSVSAIRKRVDQQQAVLDRIERHLGTLVEQTRPPAPPPPPRTP